MRVNLLSLVSGLSLLVSALALSEVAKPEPLELEKKETTTDNIGGLLARRDLIDVVDYDRAYAEGFQWKAAVYFLGDSSESDSTGSGTGKLSGTTGTKSTKSTKSTGPTGSRSKGTKSGKSKGSKSTKSGSPSSGVCKNNMSGSNRDYGCHRRYPWCNGENDKAEADHKTGTKCYRCWNNKDGDDTDAGCSGSRPLCKSVRDDAEPDAGMLNVV